MVELRTSPKTEMVELSSSVQFVSDKLDTTNVLLQYITRKLSKLETRNQLEGL